MTDCANVPLRRVSLNTSDLVIPDSGYVGRSGPEMGCDGHRFGRIAGGLRPVSVVGSFDAEVRHLAFHDARVGASSAGGQQVPGYLP
jgi:hypothetical protein